MGSPKRSSVLSCLGSLQDCKMTFRGTLFQNESLLSWELLKLRDCGGDGGCFWVLGLEFWVCAQECLGSRLDTAPTQ